MPKKDEAREATIELIRDAHRTSRENVKELNKDRIKNCSSCNKSLTQITDELSASWFDEEKRAYRFFAFCSTPCKDNLWSKYGKSEVNNVRL